MRYKIIFFLVYISFAACTQIDYMPKYKDYKNDLERENLIGKVKEIKLFKAIINNIRTENIEKAEIQKLQKFNNNGFVTFGEYYGGNANPYMTIENIYDKRGLKVQNILNYTNPEKKYVQFSIFDTVNKNVISSKIYEKDTLRISYTLKYDDNKNVIESKSIQNTDTVFTRYKYLYDADNNMLNKEQIQDNGFKSNKYINKFKYNKYGDVIELTYSSPFADKNKTIYEYDNQRRIKKIIKYKKNKLTKAISFDKFYNKLQENIYDNNQLSSQIKYHYKFDNKGNWILRDVYKTEVYGKEKRTSAIYRETREISYY